MPHPLKVTFLMLAWRALRVVLVVLACLALLYLAAFVGAWDAAYWRALDGGPP